MELCQMVQEFLYEHNKPPEGSFFDGMMRQQAAVEHERKVSRNYFLGKSRHEFESYYFLRLGSVPLFLQVMVC